MMTPTKPAFVPHASDRSAERMGIGVSLDDLKGMCAKILDGKSIRLRDKRNAEQHLVTWNGRAFRVVYDRPQNIIRTILDPINTKPKRGHRG